MVDCSICLDRKDGKPVLIAGHRVCADCFSQEYVPQFHRALAHEAHYPVRWGEGVELDPHKYRKFFDDPDDFVGAWETKEEEYNTPLKERVYCSSCKAFLAQKSEEGEVGITQSCAGCGDTTYLCCGAADISNDGDHACAEEDETAFEGLVRGEHWQMCPNPKCKMLVELLEACNAVRCPNSACKTPFCIVCGQACTANSGHWGKGRPCPRWGLAKTKNAIFDHPIAIRSFGDQLNELYPRVLTRLDPELFDKDITDRLYESRDRQYLDWAINLAADAILAEPAIFNDSDMTPFERSQAELDAGAIRRMGPIGKLQRLHLKLLDKVETDLDGRIPESVKHNTTLPSFVHTAIVIVDDLRRVLEFYVDRVPARTKPWSQAYSQWKLMNKAFGDDSMLMLEHFSDLYRVLVPYLAASRVLGTYIDFANTSSPDRWQN